MRFEMRIGDVFPIPGKGIAVVGINRELDALTPEEIVSMIPDVITIARKDGQHIEVKVLDREITNSLIDQKNIFVLIPLQTDPAFLEEGGTVYAEGPTGSQK
jgi:hypothetical protein